MDVRKIAPQFLRWLEGSKRLFVLDGSRCLLEPARLTPAFTSQPTAFPGDENSEKITCFAAWGVVKLEYWFSKFFYANLGLDPTGRRRSRANRQAWEKTISDDLSGETGGVLWAGEAVSEVEAVQG